MMSRAFSDGLPRKPAILFVCAANRCRSPLAMVLLRHMLAEEQFATAWQVESAGLHAVANLPATELAQRAAGEAGLDVRGHLSRTIEQVALERYQLILTMEQIQAEALASAYGHFAGAIMPFGMLVNLRIDIEDPTGEGLAEHRALLALLRRYLHAGMPRLRELMAVSG